MSSTGRYTAALYAGRIVADTCHVLAPHVEDDAHLAEYCRDVPFDRGNLVRQQVGKGLRGQDRSMPARRHETACFRKPGRCIGRVPGHIGARHPLVLFGAGRQRDKYPTVCKPCMIGFQMSLQSGGSGFLGPYVNDQSCHPSARCHSAFCPKQRFRSWYAPSRIDFCPSDSS